MLYAVLTGRPPFQAASSLETLKQVIEREPVPLRQLNAVVPRDLETIVLKCLEKSVPRRYASAQALADDLRRYLEGRPILARPAGRWEHAWRWCPRQPVVAGLSAAAVLLVVLVAVTSTAGYVSTSRALDRVVAAQRELALEQVSTLRTAEISRVPNLIEGLKPFRAEIVPQLREMLQQPDLSEKERLRMSLAMLMIAEDEGQAAYLCDRLLTAEPAELLVIRDGLLPHRDKLAANMWWIADDPAASKARRFRAYRALAGFDPASQRWTTAGKPVTEDLVAENPLLAATWVEALRPIRRRCSQGFRLSSATRAQRLAADVGDGHSGRLRRGPSRRAGRSGDGSRRKAIRRHFSEAQGARRRGSAFFATRSRETDARRGRGGKRSFGQATGECGGRPVGVEPAGKGLAALEARPRSARGVT